jgi:hypothetical protein
MQQNIEDQKRNTWRAWLRWVVASMVGGMVSTWSTLGIAIVGINFVGQPQPALDIGGILRGIMVLLFSAFFGGAFGGVTHCLLVKRSRISIWWWMAKWAFSFLVAMIVTTPFIGIDNYSKSIQLIVLMLLGAVLGLVISAILGDTRPRRDGHAPGP